MSEAATVESPTVRRTPPKRPHLLLFGWFCEGTGFTRVLLSLLPHLHRQFRITWMGVGYRGEPFQLAPEVRVLPVNRHGGDLVGAYAARMEWQSLAPDAVLALNDLWYLEHYARELAGRLDGVPMVGYAPVDGDIPDAEPVRGLTGFTHLFTYTEHAADQLRSALRRCGSGTPVSVAGHGVDLDAFTPTPGMRDAGFDPRLRMQLAQGVFGLSEPAWVVLNASRPDPRKRIDLSLVGFARALRELPGNVYLCLHQAIAHEQFVEPLREQARNLGVAERVLWWPPRLEPLDDADLCALYRASAIGLNTSLGEGFGLVSFEHAATGAPQVLPDHAALRELWGDAAVLLEPVRPVRTNHSPLVQGEVDAESVGSALCRLYRDDVVYRRYAEAVVARCSAADLRWEVGAERLIAVLRSGMPEVRRFS